MIKIENRYGKITITSDYFAELVGRTASSCFGVAGMVTSSPMQTLRSFASKKGIPDKGVKVSVVKGQLIIDLHIAVAFGVNISVIVSNIASQVKYAVEDATSLKVYKVNVFVEEMKNI